MIGPSVCPLDQDEVIAARTATSSLTAPLANEATRLVRARPIREVSPPSTLHQIIVEFRDDVASLDQSWYASFDRGNRDRSQPLSAGPGRSSLDE
jgi:hypothetical protein